MKEQQRVQAVSDVVEEKKRAGVAAEQANKQLNQEKAR